ncbi:chromate transporter [Rhodobacter capsulatus]|uniref:chromate transporter n=1 Tax=Rhodobacter capsulatus TaxID=1061 RepID=UPI0020164F6B|nr:chromate transporter [Rhodobacter capsulatus]
MHRILAQEKRWLGDARFLHTLNFCILLPGPEAQQLATYIGLLMQGVKGALLGRLLFITPGITALSCVHALWGKVGLVSTAFFGLKAGAIAAQAVTRVAKRALKNRAQRAVAVATFVGIFLFALPFPLIVAEAAPLGALGGVLSPGAFGAAGMARRAVRSLPMPKQFWAKNMAIRPAPNAVPR